MDIVLDFMDKHVLTPHVYPESWAEDDMWRQFISLYFITMIGGVLVYLPPATLSYLFLFDHNLKKHPKWIPNQEWLEVKTTLSSVPGMALPTALLFMAEVRGNSKLYDNISERGTAFWVVSAVAFLLFTDCCIYWIHRWLHLPIFYGPLHKLHHKWKVPSPFASHAFHPVDGFMQSLPYHIYPFLFPLHKGLYLGFFVFVNFWSISIHDEFYAVPKVLRPYINGCAHHTDHHLKFTVNYGEFFTFWDRIGGSFEDPGAYHGDGPYDQLAEHLRKKSGSGRHAPMDKPTSVKDTKTA
eukprot:m.22777 g.22777  ORF g.22777 m.22777 type:complete len:296 (-) comp6947_c0_seq1:130-1017(-)